MDNASIAAAMVTQTPPDPDTTLHQRWQYAALSVIIALSIIFNGMVLLTVGSSRQLHRTVFYLLASLAVSDILHALVVMAPSLVYTVIEGCWQPRGLCLAVQSAEGILTASSMSHICLLICDCHTALLRPLQYQLRQVNAYSALNILITWVFAIVIAIPFIGVINAIPLHTEQHCSMADCNLYKPEHSLTKAGCIVLLPVLVMIALYSCAHSAIIKQQSIVHRMQDEAQSGTTSNGDVTGLDRLEHDIVSEKTITQTIDICCQLAGVGPISHTLSPSSHVETGTICHEEDDAEKLIKEEKKDEQLCNGTETAALEHSASLNSINSIQCVAEVHKTLHDDAEVHGPSELASSPDAGLAPVETANPLSQEKQEEAEDDDSKKTKEELNAPVEPGDVDVDFDQAYDNPAYEDETPLATSIRQVHDPGTEPAEDSSSPSSSKGSSPPLPKSTSSCPPTRQPSTQTDDLENGRRSILRRDNSHRCSIPKSVKFASTVKTKEIARSIHRVPTGRRVQRQGSVRNPHKLVRQMAVTENDSHENSMPKKENGSVAHNNGINKNTPLQNGALSSLIAGLQVGKLEVPDYIAQLHQRQEKRITLRVHRQRSILKLVAVVASAFLLLVLPNCIYQMSISLCSSCHPQAQLALGLQWLSRCSCFVNPVLYYIVVKDFKTSFKKLFCFGQC